jgi:hypothetical protein
VKGKHRANRTPTPDWPMVYFRGVWLRCGSESRYDAWPVMGKHQPTWQLALCVRPGVSP